MLCGDSEGIASNLGEHIGNVAVSWSGGQQMGVSDGKEGHWRQVLHGCSLKGPEKV